MSKSIKALSVFCGSNIGKDPVYRDFAVKMADSLVLHDIELVYGGASVGLMGAIADRVLSLGGKVTGVIPESLANLEISHQGLTKLYIVNTMHERKALLSKLSQGVIMLPGGTGSLDEFFEFFTWGQLGFHKYPCGILNINHYYDYLLKFIDHSVKEGFLKKEHRDMILIDECPTDLLNQFFQYEAPTVTKWINDKTQTSSLSFDVLSSET